MEEKTHHDQLISVSIVSDCCVELRLDQMGAVDRFLCSITRIDNRHVLPSLLFAPVGNWVAPSENPEHEALERCL